MAGPTIVAPKHLDIELPAQADGDYTFQLTDEDGDEIDISEETVTLVVFRRRTDPVPLIEMTNEPGEHFDGEGNASATTGETTFSLVPSDTDWMTGEEELVSYEVWRIYEGGTKRFPWFEGGMLFSAVRGV